jgi:cell wall assembly regulator SMI1
MSAGATGTSWTNFTTWMAASMPSEYAKLRGPASGDSFAYFTEVVGVPFPADLRAIYEINDGSEDGDVFGLTLLSVARIVDEWTSWEQIRREDRDNDWNLGEFATSFPAGAIKLAYSSAGWIPFLYDYGGNVIGVDIDPGQAGVRGQVINFGTDEEDKFVVAASVKAFLDYLNRLISDRGADVKLQPDGTASFNVRGSTHLIDGLQTLIVNQ